MISSYRGNRPTNTARNPHTDRQDRLQYTALQLAHSVIKYIKQSNMKQAFQSNLSAWNAVTPLMNAKTVSRKFRYFLCQFCTMNTRIFDALTKQMGNHSSQYLPISQTLFLNTNLQHGQNSIVFADRVNFKDS